MKCLIFLFLSISTLFSMQQIQITGKALLNEKPLTQNDTIKIGDTVSTEAISTLKFTINHNAFKLSPNSKMKLINEKGKQILNVIQGSVMAVFEPHTTKFELKTPNMTAGIRGTGVFVHIENDKTYFCNCYGKTHTHNLHTNTDTNITSTHHEMYWFTQDGTKPSKDMLSHTDDELRELEGIVGRIPDFDK